MVDDDESDDALEASADDAADANEGRLKRELRKGRLKRDERRDGGAGQERWNARTVAIEVSLPFVENESERGRKGNHSKMVSGGGKERNLWFLAQRRIPIMAVDFLGSSSRLF